MTQIKIPEMKKNSFFHILRLVLICIIFAALGCANISLPVSSKEKTWYDIVRQSNERIGSFENIYKGDPDLAGLEVYQKPVVDNALVDSSAYIERHPGTINYHFWNGRILNVQHSPDGKVLERQWWRHSVQEEPGYLGSWEMVDFSAGSDPDFSLHPDPRNLDFIKARQ